MINQKHGDLLPDAIYAPFIARKVEDAEVYWRNTFGHNDIDLLDYCHSSQIDQFSIKSDKQTARTYLADRYGGTGIGSCGGSARCGTYFGVQVKGIGLTPLHGLSKIVQPDRWHQDGLLLLGEAIKEAIWSSICETALPYGAVSTFGIVVIDHRRKNKQEPFNGAASLQSRALLLRPAVVRPAHFLRNAMFTLERTSAIGVISDIERTNIAIARIPSIFAAIGFPVNNSNPIAIVNEGLLEMAKRFAAQVATAFVKRLFHRALACSNIALDGRYLDFGTMTTIDGYRRMAGSPSPGGPDQWNQHAILKTTFIALRKQIVLHLAGGVDGRIIATEELLSHFEEMFELQKELEFIKLFGLSENEAVGAPRELSREVQRVMRDVFERGGDERFTSRAPNDTEVQCMTPMSSNGRYDVNRLLRRLASVKEIGSQRNILDEELNDAALARRFLNVQAALQAHRRSMDWEANSEVNESRRLEAQAKRNASLSFLSHDAIDIALSGLSPTAENISHYIDTTVRRAQEIVAM